MDYICVICGEVIYKESCIIEPDGKARHCFCSPKAERSEVLQGCPPSATGSAGTRAPNAVLAELAKEWRCERERLYSAHKKLWWWPPTSGQARIAAAVFGVCAMQLERAIRPDGQITEITDSGQVADSLGRSADKAVSAVAEVEDVFFIEDGSGIGFSSHSRKSAHQYLDALLDRLKRGDGDGATDWSEDITIEYRAMTKEEIDALPVQ